jgi:hypothetical protein
MPAFVLPDPYRLSAAVVPAAAWLRSALAPDDVERRGLVLRLDVSEADALTLDAAGRVTYPCAPPAWVHGAIEGWKPRLSPDCPAEPRGGRPQALTTGSPVVWP